MSTAPHPPSYSAGVQPAWNVALLFPHQGDWEQSDYLALSHQSNRLVELVDGNLEVLPKPKTSHQLIVLFLLDMLRAFVSQADAGLVLIAPLCVRVGPKSFREPDLVFMSKENVSRAGEDFWDGADLVMEVVSPDRDSHDRDYIKKRRDYADAGIKEYWIVDPQTERITVLALDGNQYRVHGEFVSGDLATSALLRGFATDVAATFAAGKKLA